MMFGMCLRVSYAINTLYFYNYLEEVGQYKDYEIVGAWIKSITNHMYWCAASAPDGDGKLMVDRWKSLISHLIDQHDDCFHLPLGDRRKKWLTPGTYCSNSIYYILTYDSN